MEAPIGTNESIRETLKSSSMIRFHLKKRPIIAVVEKNKGAKSSSSKIMTYNRRENQMIPIFPHFPCVAKKAVALLEQWINDNVIHLLEVELFASVTELNDPRHCHFHKKKGHSLEQCVTSRKIFYEKHT